MDFLTKLKVKEHLQSTWIVPSCFKLIGILSWENRSALGHCTLPSHDSTEGKGSTEHIKGTASDYQVEFRPVLQTWRKRFEAVIGSEGGREPCTVLGRQTCKVTRRGLISSGSPCSLQSNMTCALFGSNKFCHCSETREFMYQFKIQPSRIFTVTELRQKCRFEFSSVLIWFEKLESLTSKKAISFQVLWRTFRECVGPTCISKGCHPSFVKSTWLDPFSGFLADIPF